MSAANESFDELAANSNNRYSLLSITAYNSITTATHSLVDVSWTSLLTCLNLTRVSATLLLRRQKSCQFLFQSLQKLGLRCVLKMPPVFKPAQDKGDCRRSRLEEE